MEKAFVLVSTEPAKEKEVYNSITKIEGVTELNTLFGEYDLIVTIEGEDFNYLGKVVDEYIENVEGVVSTKTLAGIKF